MKVALVSFPWASNSPYKFLSELIKILDPISDKIILIDGNTDRVHISSDKVQIEDIGINIHFAKDIRPYIYSIALWLTKCIFIQIIESIKIIKFRKNIDLIIFYVAYPYYLLPLITAKILGINTVEIITRSKSKYFLSRVLRLQDIVLFRLLDGISPESRSLINELRLDKYEGKLLVDGARFIDIDHYNVTKAIDKRDNLVGYISRITKQKGIMEFINAIPMISEKNKNIKILIGGSGDLLNEVNEVCFRIRRETNSDITLTGWIGQDLPTHLNELKLLVLPTLEDSFPSIILESMACGTPVLTTNVGAIADIITDGENGFILPNNSPECIAKKVMEIIKNPNLKECSDNALRSITEKYTYESAVERYKIIINTLGAQRVTNSPIFRSGMK